MTTTQAIELIESNYSMSYRDKIKLLGIVQEVEQYRRNPVATMTSCAKYVHENDINDQLQKLKDEIAEFEAAPTWDEKVKEWFDIVQVGITGFGILAEKYNEDIKEVVKEGQAKNDKRAYNVRSSV